MKSNLIHAVAGAVLAAVVAATAADAQAPPAAQQGPEAPRQQGPEAPQPQTASLLTPELLNQMVAPIALYPDELLGEILMEVWSISRTMPRAASILFGMAPRVTQTISRLALKDIERIVARNACHLRPRWEHSRTFWPRLLRAITGTDNEAMMDIQLHCLSLLGS